MDSVKIGRGWRHRDEKPAATSVIASDIYRNIINDVYPPNEYQILNEGARARVVNINEYYEYYNLEGQYWEPPGGLDYEPTIMPVNLARWFVRKRAAWMFERSPDVECPVKTVDSVEKLEAADYQPSRKQKTLIAQAQAREQMLYDIHEANQFDEALIEGARDYLIGGTVALRIHHDPARGIRTLFKPAQEVFPFMSREDPDELEKVHFCAYYDNDRQIWKQTWEMVDGKCYLTEGVYDRRLEPLWMIHNHADTYLDFIPVILFPNERLAGDVFGTSILKDMIPLFDQYNRMMSDASDALRFNMFAVTVLLNAAPGAEKKLRVSPHAVWNIGGDEDLDVKKLESMFSYNEALKQFLQRLENVMHLIGEVPDVGPEKMQGFQLVSGIALKMLYADLVAATQQGWRTWKPRMAIANRYIFRMLEAYSGRSGFFYANDPDFDIAAIAESYKTRIIPHLPLPENEMEKVDLEVKKLANDLNSWKGALEDIGVENPERLMAQILAEKSKLYNRDEYAINLKEKADAESVGRERVPQKDGRRQKGSPPVDGSGS